jgi:hypothetical protein
VSILSKNDEGLIFHMEPPQIRLPELSD